MVEKCTGVRMIQSIMLVCLLTYIVSGLPKPSPVYYGCHYKSKYWDKEKLGGSKQAQRNNYSNITSLDGHNYSWLKL